MDPLSQRAASPQSIAIVAAASSGDTVWRIGCVSRSAAMAVSDVPFNGPIAGVRVCRVGGAFVANPTLAQRAEADLGAFEDKVKPIIHAVRHEGDEAVARFARQFDKAPVEADTLAATEADFARAENAAKFYLSHLVYSGRGNKNRATDSEHTATRATVLRLIDEECLLGIPRVVECV